MKVCVVGGGLAGITASLACADAGDEVTLVEARAQLGGATWSMRRNGLWFDNGQHVFLRCCESYLWLLDRIGASDMVRIQRRLDIPVLAVDGGGVREARLRRSAHLPAPLHLARCLLGYGHMSVRSRAKTVRAAMALRRIDPASSFADSLTFGQWLEDQHQPADAVDSLWDLIALATLNLPAAKASLAGAAKVFRTGLLDRADAADLGWARVPLHHLHAEPAMRSLEKAEVEVRLRQRVQRIGVDEAGVSIGTGQRFDSAVIATSHLAARELLPPGLVDGQDRLGELGTSPIVNVSFAFDSKVCEHEVFAAVGGPVQWVFDHTEASGARSGQVLTVSLSAADCFVRMRSGQLTSLLLEDLCRLLPRASRARVTEAVVTREGAATFRISPGAGAVRLGCGTNDPRIAIAGAWTNTGWPATMEGAVKSGLIAAAHLHESHDGISLRPRIDLDPQPQEVHA